MTQMTLEQALQVGLQMHQRGQLKEAENLYRQVHSHAPGHPQVMHILGMVVAQQGRVDEGISLIQAAIAVDGRDPSFHNNLGNLLREKGRLEEAEKALREAVRLRPDYAMALNNLGSVLVQQGKVDEARTSLEEAVKLQPGLAGAHLNLSKVLASKGDGSAAIEASRRAVRLAPRDGDAHRQLGTLLAHVGQLDDGLVELREAVRLSPGDQEAAVTIGNILAVQGKADEAEKMYRQALERNKDNAQALLGLGNVLLTRGKAREAEEAFRSAVAAGPELAEAHNCLGNALQALGRLDEAVLAYRKTIEIAPLQASAHNNLGLTLAARGDWEEAEAHYRRAIALDPAMPSVHSNLGILLASRGKLDEAAGEYMEALKIHPKDMRALGNLGNVLKDAGMLEDAIQCYRRVLEVEPANAEAHSAIVYTMYYHEGMSGAAHYEELKQWYRAHASWCKKEIKPHQHSRDPERRLRIGYVSMDFRDHVVARFLRPLFTTYDREKFEFYCYGDVMAPDQVTEEIRSLATRYTSIAGVPSREVAEMIRADGIDILVDLSMHTNGERLTVFARKPAPVQATWLAYAGSTGVEEVDYRITDPYLDPPGGPTGPYSEKNWRLPETFWCYSAPLGEVALPESVPSERGTVTFGSLNNFAKVSDGVLRLWAQLMARVAGSRLLIHTILGSHREKVLEVLKEAGLEPGRVEFVGKMSAREYFETYHKIDVALDPFPYGGGTTTCDALWMGVPVVTLAGKTAVGRGGVSLLSNVGAKELIAQTPEEYVEIAAALAGDVGRLKEYRRTLRGRMQASPVMDAPRFARAMEGAFREMWKTWCAGKGDGR